MKLLICFLLLFNSPQIIKLEYYSGEGVIFPKEYRNYNLSYPVQNFTPSPSQVVRAEKIMHENYYNYEIVFCDSMKIKLDHDLKNSNPKTFIRHFRNYNRQYSGYINESKDSIIFIGLLNFKNKKRIKPYFDDWKEEIFLCSGTFCFKNYRQCKVNLTTDKVVGI